MYLSYKKSKPLSFWLSILPLAMIAIFLYLWPVIRPGIAIIALPATSNVASVFLLFKIMPKSVQSFMVDRAVLAEELIAKEAELGAMANQVAQLENQMRDLERLILIATSTVEISSVAVLHPVLSDLTYLHETELFLADRSIDVDKGSVVYWRGYVAIGTVEMHSFNSVTVSPFATALRKVVGVLSGGETLVTLIGVGDGSFVAELPMDTDIEEGEIIRLASDPEYILGTVVKKDLEKSDSVMTIYISGGYNLSNMSQAYVNEK